MAEEGDGAWAREPRRLFLAVLPTPEVRAALVASQRALAPALRRGAPAAPGNLHLTLAFLGMCDAGQEEAAVRALAAACAGQVPFALRLAETGRFNKRRGDIVWQALEEDEGARELRALQARLVGALHAEGLAKGVGVGDAYAPHVTLFRGARDVRPEEGGAAAVSPAAVSPAAGVAWPVDSAALMGSHHPAGCALTYTELVRVGFGG